MIAGSSVSPCGKTLTTDFRIFGSGRRKTRRRRRRWLTLSRYQTPLLRLIQQQHFLLHVLGYKYFITFDGTLVDSLTTINQKAKRNPLSQLVTSQREIEAAYKLIKRDKRVHAYDHPLHVLVHRYRVVLVKQPIRTAERGFLLH